MTATGFPLEKLVIAAEKRAELLSREPFHNVNDPEHRQICWQCLWDWEQSK